MIEAQKLYNLQYKIPPTEAKNWVITNEIRGTSCPKFIGSGKTLHMLGGKS